MTNKLLLTVIALAACGTSISTVPINPAPHAMVPRPAGAVELFTSGPPQGRAYVDVAFFEAKQQSTLSVDDTPEFFAKLRERAGAMGCDGLVVTGMTNATTGGKYADNIKGSIATCIVYTEPPIAIAPPAPASAPISVAPASEPAAETAAP